MDYRQQVEYLKAGNYLFFPNDIISYNLSPKALSVFVYLVYLSDDMGECHPARKTIGDHCGGISRSTVDRALEKITEDRYLTMNSQYETEYNELKAQTQVLYGRITATETATMNARIFSNLIENADLKELNARILNELIERIVIHEKEIINGEKFQRVDIYYKFVGLI